MTPRKTAAEEKLSVSQANAILFDVLNDMVHKSESYKFIRMADDMHDVAAYLNDMRICFIVLTVTCYIIIVVYLIALCMRRNRRNGQQRRRNWDGYQVGKADGNYSTATSAANEELTSVRTEPVAPYMGRNHHSRLAGGPAPSFMRHGHMNHQQTTRLISEQDGAVKHQIPHITTDPPPNEPSSTTSRAPATATVPQLVKDSVDIS